MDTYEKKYNDAMERARDLHDGEMKVDREMKASYHGYKFEVDSVIGKDGMEYPAQDVVLIEPDWSSFRREAAKDILAGMLSNPEKISIRGERLATIDGFVNAAIEITDELIRQIKEK